MDFSQSPFGQFVAGSTGRIGRIVAGLLLVAVGFMLLTSLTGIVLVVVGLIPLAAGIFDFCLLSALLGGPFWGSQIRSAAPVH